MSNASNNNRRSSRRLSGIDPEHVVQNAAPITDAERRTLRGSSQLGPFRNEPANSSERGYLRVAERRPVGNLMWAILNNVFGYAELAENPPRTPETVFPLTHMMMVPRKKDSPDWGYGFVLYQFRDLSGPGVPLDWEGCKAAMTRIMTVIFEMVDQGRRMPVYGAVLIGQLMRLYMCAEADIAQNSITQYAVQGHTLLHIQDHAGFIMEELRRIGQQIGNDLAARDVSGSDSNQGSDGSSDDSNPADTRSEDHDMSDGHGSDGSDKSSDDGNPGDAEDYDMTDHESEDESKEHSDETTDSSDAQDTSDSGSSDDSSHSESSHSHSSRSPESSDRSMSSESDDYWGDGGASRFEQNLDLLRRALAVKYRPISYGDRYVFSHNTYYPRGASSDDSGTENEGDDDDSLEEGQRELRYRLRHCGPASDSDSDSESSSGAGGTPLSSMSEGTIALLQELLGEEISGDESGPSESGEGYWDVSSSTTSASTESYWDASSPPSSDRSFRSGSFSPYDNRVEDPDYVDYGPPESDTEDDETGGMDQNTRSLDLHVAPVQAMNGMVGNPVMIDSSDEMSEDGYASDEEGLDGPDGPPSPGGFMGRVASLFSQARHPTGPGGDAITTIVRVAACHAAPVFLSARQTTDKPIRLIHEAARHGARLVVFPETFIPAFPVWSAVRSPAENHPLFHRMVSQSVYADGDEALALRAAAQSAGAVVSMGISEKARGSTATLYNANLLIDRTGSVLTHHRKLMPTFFEKLTWRTAYGNIGNLICGENTNPLARYALMAQAEQIHISTWPAIWPTRLAPESSEELSEGSQQGTNYDNVAANRTRAAAHCFEAKCFGVLCTGLLDQPAIDLMRSGAHAPDTVRGALQHSPQGASLFLDPTGAPLPAFTCSPDTGERQAKEYLQHEEGILYADLDLERCIEGKQYHDVVDGYQRLDVFHLQVNRTRSEPVVFTESRESVARNVDSPALTAKEGKNPSRTEDGE
ncbi:carbon-nitrogen hydrolase [Aspergillus ellipticus CBS 707.79]|uniref:Carbon-nitrogen hydrolase n=1 Tax=Aspergillus ellipticus CBS 707.79 TaxID=1448320 RepID=A0A319EGC2_9EURO|nr:carbon-nitrogen hydrolase [Aspergillus ellipticus CBS 707.79]